MQAVMSPWSVQEIGGTAGEVWRCLKRNGKTTLAGIEQQVGAPKQLTNMAIGWLAREGKVELRQDGRSIQLWLAE